jgi:hypothetical protein
VFTGHSDGVITINVAEADDAKRELRRVQLHEPYRTLLGHFRHEIGHYYWNVLIENSHGVVAFRKAFGDETAGYAEAVQRHYEKGAPSEWQQCYISAYATMHPWEDWAETWAHYMHMIDTLETAKSHGLTLRVPDKQGEHVSTDALAFRDFEALSSSWNTLTLAMNSLNRSMGLKDAYPFVLSAKVLQKLRYVHELIQARRAEGNSALRHAG